MNLTDEEYEKLTTTTSEEEWTATCDEVKAARNGQYPPDWWPRMMLSGAIASTQLKWHK